ncbi:MAG: hypothetical protein M5U12_05850 [Verrucomicrobia bacterium]|nr:hypothetical protein [Verrucomicrobiota bacterium]
MNVTDTSREATSASVTTIGNAQMKAPLSPGKPSNGRNARMLISVPNRIGRRSRHGPSQAARPRGCPCASSRLMPSEATTGSSTNSPNARIKAAIEIWCSGTPNQAIPTSVKATVSGIASATTSAERPSIRNHATSTTTSTASAKHRLNCPIRCRTAAG